MGGVDVKKRSKLSNGNDNNLHANGIISNDHNHSLSNHHDNHHRDAVINVDRGDPKVFYPYWKKVDDKCEVTIKASEFMSYFADNSSAGVFYQLPEFTNAVRHVHRTVGNAVTDNRYIVSGTGSSQLFTVALRALASSMNAKSTINVPIPVVSAVPYYSCYEESLKEENSKMYQWYGVASTFNQEGPYVEVVTTPNNPDGTNREPVVNRKGGMVICDLAYYWPQYTPITKTMNYDIMIFTLSKFSGHAGSRVGWAIVKDKEIATKMIKQMTLMTIGTCHEGQLRATKIIEYIANCYDPFLMIKQPNVEGFFQFGHRVLAQRWKKLRAVVNHCGTFKLLDFPPEFCKFRGKIATPSPAYAWMESKTKEDASKLMNDLKIKTRGGERFGVSSRYTRISMLESDETFNLLLQRLTLILSQDLNSN